MQQALTDTGVSFAARLSAFGDRPALVTAGAVVSYQDLADRVAATADRLGTTRRLVLVAGTNEVQAIVTYLAALAAGHPVILVPGDNPGNLSELVSAYNPDVTYSAGRLVERRAGTAHDLHPDLALLLSTSGSTGSPKLVRLSAANVESNAEAIATYLSIRPSDVAATTLPMHYCYGLSVINSHLMSGASLLLTSLSVVDECFWDLFRRNQATTFAGVPYTFELLDRAGFADRDLPSLRYVTQAGGRMSPTTVTRYAELGQRRGWDLFVMYGQTEATARMAYLPPDLALSSPSSIGIAIPGGSFRLEPLPEMPLTRNAAVLDEQATEVGELVYSGDNVMLGYATSPEDLARGREVTTLRTGDVARRNREGLYEVIGRRNRFAKVFGLRIDLDQAERVFADHGITACCADDEERLVVAVDCSAKPVDADAVQAVAKQSFGVPPGAVHVSALTQIPRLPSGKPDYRAIVSSAAAPGRGRPSAVSATADLCRLYGDVLRRTEVSEDDSFVSLEGDSLSYVEMSIRLEEAIGHLPANWHLAPIRELTPRRRRSGLRSVEGNVVLRALAIVLIVGSHANLFWLLGGAHVLLGLAGYNFGRFQLTDVPRRERVRRLTTSIARVAVPSVLWIGIAAAFSAYTWQNAVLLNGILGPRDWAEPQWHYWFIEALVYTLVALTLVMAVPFVDRIERRWPFWLPMALAGAGLLTRFEVVTVFGGDVIHRANVLFWLFALGWATVRAEAWWQRLLVSVTVVATVPGFFDDPARDLVVIAGMLALVWVRTVRVPGWTARVAGVLASASLYIYLAHWQIYPHLEDSQPLLATGLSLLGGVLVWQAVNRCSPYVEKRLARRLARTA
ncbi:MAG: Polyketide synthase modules and related proteins [uncultured Nocardioidaceae bacterium]|uniref:Polyketide synthase modules and related proteins n=1 Tax=uncultured Nocardioidaceae bacterium TaxID=253824 RepID=A0A6J4LXZ0_9ACTN|nr:MAG: Polyketide synthase modules and related proteins [uncultured Nocardioidaceae bacterium]